MKRLSAPQMTLRSALLFFVVLVIALVGTRTLSNAWHFPWSLVLGAVALTVFVITQALTTSRKVTIPELATATSLSVLVSCFFYEWTVRFGAGIPGYVSHSADLQGEYLGGLLAEAKHKVCFQGIHCGMRTSRSRSSRIRAAWSASFARRRS
ncbi:MAG: hypothetical protein M9894_00585 [Planctomycetes bacterium]|nr:hypothetical protein [Planctomycetota bacterium]